VDGANDWIAPPRSASGANDWVAPAKQSDDWVAPPEAQKTGGALRTAENIGLVYPAVEAGLNLLTQPQGFGGYLAGAIGGLENKYLLGGKTDPKEFAEKVYNAVTYQPQTQRGQELASTAMSPLAWWNELAEKVGHWVADVTGSPVMGAVTEATGQMAPSFVGGPLARAHEKTFGGYSPPPPAGEGFFREGPPQPKREPVTPPKMARTIQRVQQDTQGLSIPMAPGIKGIIKEIKAGGPPQLEMPVGQAPEGVERPTLPILNTIKEAQDDWVDVPLETALPEAETPRHEPVLQPGEPEYSGAEVPYEAYNHEIDYGVRPLKLPRSERRVDSLGQSKKIFEVVQPKTEFERVLADAGRDWETKEQKDRTRTALSAYVRQMKGDEARRFAAFKDMPPSKQVEAAQQYWATIRSHLDNAFDEDQEGAITRGIQVVAPDADKALFYQKGETGGVEGGFKPPPMGTKPGAEAGEPPLREREPGEDEDEIGPATLGANPFMSPSMLARAFSSLYKKFAGAANAIQSAPESAQGAIAPIIRYNLAIEEAKQTAQRDVIEGEKRADALRQDYEKLMGPALAANPRMDINLTPKDVREAAAQVEKMKRTIAAAELRDQLIKNGYAMRRWTPPEEGDEAVYRTPLENISDLHDPKTGRSLLLREDIMPMVKQAIATRDLALQRDYARSKWGKAEAVSHAAVGWLMQWPQFHMVTEAGKIISSLAPFPPTSRGSLFSFVKSANRAINDRDELSGWVKAGFQPFALRAKMEPTGAEMGAVEQLTRKYGGPFENVYDAYQWVHKNVLANFVNTLQMAFAQQRLDQQIRAAQKRGETVTPEKYTVFKMTAAQESNPIGGNLPIHELNRTLYRGLGVLFFSRGLQVSTVRMATRAFEDNEIVRAIAKEQGYTPAQANKLVRSNTKFLLSMLALEYVTMQIANNSINYVNTQRDNAPDKNGKRGGHFIWDNPGATAEDALFPNRIYWDEDTYISSPMRTVRDIVEYAMAPYELATGQQSEILTNKLSVPVSAAIQSQQGRDWAGRPFTGALDRAAAGASQMMPTPFQQMPQYAAEAIRDRDTSMLGEGFKEVFSGKSALQLMGLQPHVTHGDQNIQTKALAQNQEESKLIKLAMEKKQLIKLDTSPEDREKIINEWIDEAHRVHMSGAKIGEWVRYLRRTGPSPASVKAAGRYDAAQRDKSGVNPPPPMP